MTTELPTPTSSGGRLRFHEGGWLLLLAGLLTLALLSWALAPSVFRMVDRPPGDGKTIESYAFDLSDPRTSLENVLPAMLYRDMAPVLDTPVILSPAEVTERNAARKPYLIPDDLVIGVTRNGQARAYPISILNVHEIINDELDGVPLAVTWHWPSGTMAVMDRSIGDTRPLLGVSGLVSHGNMLLYPRREGPERGGEPLISQARHRSITGPDVTLERVPHEVVRWEDWVARYPETSVVAPVPDLKQRYKKGKPDVWFASSQLMFGVAEPAFGPGPKEAVMIVTGPTGQHVLPLEALNAIADSQGRANVTLDDQPLTILTTINPATARLAEDSPPGWSSLRTLWITAHAIWPDARLWTGAPESPPEK